MIRELSLPICILPKTLSWCNMTLLFVPPLFCTDLEKNLGTKNRIYLNKGPKIQTRHGEIYCLLPMKLLGSITCTKA